MAMNEFGEGLPVQQSLIEANGDWHMGKAIDHFKRVHGDHWKMLRVIVVDKDMNEIRMLQENFPEAQVLLCKFHVIKYLKERCAKPEYGKISAEDQANIQAVIKNMVNAKNADVYDDNCDILRSKCKRIGFDLYWEYFERNWHSCQDLWVSYRRAHLHHFSDHTNNRLEGWFSKFKDGVGPQSSMSECVEGLVKNALRIENEYKYREARPGQYFNAAYDDEMATVLRFTTHFVAKRVEPEYAAGLANDYTFEVDQDAAVVRVQGPKMTRTVNMLDWKCDCEFSDTMQLPCRHAIAFRKRRGLTPLIPCNRIDERYVTAVWKRRMMKYSVS
jgi:hypothetical protein